MAVCAGQCGDTAASRGCPTSSRHEISHLDRNKTIQPTISPKARRRENMLKNQGFLLVNASSLAVCLLPDGFHDGQQLSPPSPVLSMCQPFTEVWGSVGNHFRGCMIQPALNVRMPSCHSVQDIVQDNNIQDNVHLATYTSPVMITHLYRRRLISHMGDKVGTSKDQHTGL